MDQRVSNHRNRPEPTVLNSDELMDTLFSQLKPGTTLIVHPIYNRYHKQLDFPTLVMALLSYLELGTP